MGGQIAPNKYTHKDNNYLPEEQTRHVYKNIESSGMIDINTQTQEISMLDDTSRYINPYRE